MNSDELSKQIENLCKSKAEEFALMGYEKVEDKEIWQCVSEKYNQEELPPLHKIVNDILSLKVTSFMNWLTINAYKADSFDFEEMK